MKAPNMIYKLSIFMIPVAFLAIIAVVVMGIIEIMDTNKTSFKNCMANVDNIDVCWEVMK